MNIVRLYRVESNRGGRVRNQERMCRASRVAVRLEMPTLWIRLRAKGTVGAVEDKVSLVVALAVLSPGETPMLGGNVVAGLTYPNRLQ